MLNVDLMMEVVKISFIFKMVHVNFKVDELVNNVADWVLVFFN